MHLYTLVTLFWCFIRKYLSHTLYCSQLVSVSFKIHCLQMLQLFQTNKGSFFFHRHTCIQWLHSFPYIMHCIHLSHFFGASSENICPIHYIVHSSSQSVSHWISVFSFKIHCLQMLQLFQTKNGSIFHHHTCIQWLHSFSLYNALYTLVTLFWCFIRKYLSHSLYCAQLISVCFTLNLCFLL